MRKVYLYDIESAGIIIETNSGIIWTNQTGGVCCHHPSQEGIFLPQELPYSFTDYMTDRGPLSEEEYNQINNYLKEVYLRVVPDDKNEEAWLRVEILSGHPQKDFTGMIGRLTWENSD